MAANFDVARIEEKIDRAEAGAVTVNSKVGGISFQSMIEVMEFAKLMATADLAVPPHLRGNPGACLAITIQATEWKMSPFAVANKSYIANDRMAFESQLIHSVVEARAPLKGRLRHEIIGEGDERRCKVWGTFKGEDEPHTYISETLGILRGARGTNDRGQVKGSPLWAVQPEVQLFYSATRTWARMFCPDVILGIYAPDELPEEPKDITPPETGLAKRLKDKTKKGRGFDHEHVEREASAVADAAKATGTVIEGEQLDIEVEAKLKKAFDDGKSAPDGAKAPTDITEAEAVRWAEGYHSVKRQTVDAQ